MVHFTFHSNQLSERDIYAVDKVESLSAFLKPERSLCLVHDPQWVSAGPELLRISGRKRNGETDNVYLAEGGNWIDQGYHRCLLGKTLASPFLFASWKKRGIHRVSLIRPGLEPIRFGSFDEALSAYLPEGFTAERSYRRKSSLFVLMLMAMQRRQLLSELIAVLRAWEEKLQQQTEK